MKYTDLTIHQRISLKDVICNKKYRDSIFGTKREDKSWQLLHFLGIISGFRTAVEQYLNQYT